MARRSGGSGRTLALFGLGIAVLVALMAVAGTWRPALDVDLTDGSRVLLQAADEPTPGRLAEAAALVEQRVESLDVAGADVFTRGADTVVVEVAGAVDPRLVGTVQPRGRLGIRIVACSSGVQGPCAQASAPDGERPADEPEPAPEAPSDVPGALAWSAQPPAAWTEQFASLTCATVPGPTADEPDRPIVACDDQGVKYLLTPAVVDGSRVAGAEAVQAGTGTWQVQLDLDDPGTRTFADLSEALVQGRRQFAVVLDGRVVTAPTMQGLVTDGNPSFTGTFDQRGARSLAETIDVGTLPLAFAPEPVVQGIGPSAPTRAALLAALAGLVAVCVAGVVRYRRVGLVGVLALAAAGFLVWAALTLLGQGIGLTTGLPAVAGLGIGVGLVTGSFVVLAERVRSELAVGKSAATALEDAWPPARNALLAGGAAVVLTALVAVVVGAGAVRAGALTVGLVAVADVVVLLLLVRPMLDRLGAVPPTPSSTPRDALPGQPRAWHAVTAGLLVLAAVGLAWPGLQPGSDVAGGTELRLTTPGVRPSADLLDDLRAEATAQEGVRQAEVYAAGEGLVVRTEKLDAEESESLGAALAAVADAEAVTTAKVGATWRAGHVVRALLSVGVVLLLALVLLRWWTGGLRPAVAAGVAILVDLVVVAGVGTLFGLTVSTATLGGLLAVLAWSLHDKVLVLARVSEVTRGLRRTRGSWTEAVRAASAGMLGRTVATAATVLVPALAVVVAGLLGLVPPVLADLALLLGIGVVVVAWSSLFVAVPLLVRLRTGEKDFRQAERRATARRTRPHRVSETAAPAAKPAAPGRPARQQVRTSGAAKRAQPSRRSRASRGRGKGGRR